MFKLGRDWWIDTGCPMHGGSIGEADVAVWKAESI